LDEYSCKLLVSGSPDRQRLVLTSARIRLHRPQYDHSCVLQSNSELPAMQGVIFCENSWKVCGQFNVADRRRTQFQIYLDKFQAITHKF